MAKHRVALIGLGVMLGLATWGPQLANASGPHDGTYRGATKLTVNSLVGRSDSCAGNAAGVASSRVIADNKLKMPWGTNTFEVPVAADGTIKGSAAVGQAQINVNGKVTAGALSVTFASQWCGYEFQGRKG